MDLPQPIVEVLVYGKVAELRELEHRICRAGLLAASRDVLGRPAVVSAGSGTFEVW
jgi:hypothetical protein